VTKYATEDGILKHFLTLLARVVRFSPNFCYYAFSSKKIKGQDRSERMEALLCIEF